MSRAGCQEKNPGSSPQAGFSESFRHWLSVLPVFNEAQARLYVAQKALEFGRGGISKMARLTGMSRPTIMKGLGELERGIDPERARSIRKKGAGRKRVEAADSGLLRALERIMEENTAGDPMSYLKWTGKSVRKISEELAAMGHQANPNTVSRLLKEMGFSLCANVKCEEGKPHPDRDAQFRYINEQTKAFLRAVDPVISVDTKKKELVGNFKNQGRAWRREDKLVKVYDFPSDAEGKAIPYGIYDIQQNTGMVNVGITHDTAEFAVESITQWWKSLGVCCYPKSKRLLVCADGGGSNGSRSRLWKVALQQFANAFALEVTVLHYPPGTSKWNKIEHKMFSFISINWKGEPLVSYETVINLISTTTTKSGLKIIAQLDQRNYDTGKTISDEQMAALNIQGHKKHPEWNYTVCPRPGGKRS